MGTLHGTHGHSRLPRARQPRPRTCFRKGCGRRYQPRRWNQRYCQDLECLRQVRRWQDARRQAKRRRDDRVNAQHAASFTRAVNRLNSHIVLVNACKASESGVTPIRQKMTEMGKFNEGLIKAGIMLVGDIQKNA